MAGHICAESDATLPSSVQSGAVNLEGRRECLSWTAQAVIFLTDDYTVCQPLPEGHSGEHLLSLIRGVYNRKMWNVRDYLMSAHNLIATF